MKYRLSDDGAYMIGTTRKGMDFLFSTEDYEIIKKYSWFVSKRGYITTNIKRTSRPLHVILMGRKEGMDIDHISRDKMDNRRENLRFCTHQQNSFNQKKRCTNTSGYTGVSYLKNAKRYESYVHHNGEKHRLGLFHIAEEAAMARDKKANELFGEFAVLNFPQEMNGYG